MPGGLHQGLCDQSVEYIANLNRLQPIERADRFGVGEREIRLEDRQTPQKRLLAGS